MTLIIFGRALFLPFFFDDLVHLPFVDQYSLAELWASAADAPYYRPLTFSVWKLFYLILGEHNPIVHHGINLFLHAFNGLLVGLLSLRLYRMNGHASNRLPLAGSGILGASIYLVFPFHYQTIPWPGALSQILVTSLTLGSILAYLAAEDTRHRWAYLSLGLGLAALAPFAHENGVLVGPLLFLIELMRFRPTRWRTAILYPALFTLPALLWLPLRFSITTGREELEILANWEAVYQNLVYFFQGLTFPFTIVGQRVMALTGWGDFRTIFVLGGAALFFVIFLAWTSRLTLWRMFLLGIGWWFIGIGPALIVFDFDYVIKGPRLMTLAAVGIALFWEAAILSLHVDSSDQSHKSAEPQNSPNIGHFRRFKGVIGILLSLFIAGGGGGFLWQQMSHYQMIGSAYHQTVEWAFEAEKQNQQLVFINFPARVVKQPLTFAVGHEGVSFWPVYAPHRSIVTINGGPPNANPVFLSYDGIRLEQPYLYNLVNPNGDLGEIISAGPALIVQTIYREDGIELI
ncbi:MAG: hypothetical protein AAF633_20625, partial [Chloroflexota bacterium]